MLSREYDPGPVQIGPGARIHPAISNSASLLVSRLFDH
jgi:hypothetical protein